jgi:hypothetical protein
LETPTWVDHTQHTEDFCYGSWRESPSASLRMEFKSHMSWRGLTRPPPLTNQWSLFCSRPVTFSPHVGPPRPEFKSQLGREAGDAGSVLREGRFGVVKSSGVIFSLEKGGRIAEGVQFGRKACGGRISATTGVDRLPIRTRRHVPAQSRGRARRHQGFSEDIDVQNPIPAPQPA